jgi:hypothetical protein
MNELGDLIVAGIREDISEPYPPSSAPGENPHSRTGNLLQGVAQQTEAFEGGYSCAPLSTSTAPAAIRWCRCT